MIKKKVGKILTLVLAFIVFFTTTTKVHASIAKISLNDDIAVAVSPGSYYTSTDLFTNFKDVMPGDVLYEDITIINDIDKYDSIKVYLRAILHDEHDNPLSKNVAADNETVATMNDFISKLGLKVSSEDKIIFDAQAGDLNGLLENVYLGSLSKNESLDIQVQLYVPINLGNEYANRTGEVDWALVIEEDYDVASGIKPPSTGINNKLFSTYASIILSSLIIILLVKSKEEKVKNIS